jgi:DNA-directed RNA polymerase subunit beta
MHGAEKSQQTVTTFLTEAAKLSGKDWVYNPENPGKLVLRDGRTGLPLISRLPWAIRTS